MTSYSSLLCSHADLSTLDEFVARVVSTTGIRDIEERQSSNYVEERYFAGRYEDLKCTIAYADELENLDRPYWIALEGDVRADALISMVNELSLQKLLPAGFKVARMVNFGTFDEQRIDY